MDLVVLGLSHKTAPVQIRERFAIPEEDLAGVAGRIRDSGCIETFVLSTCNRVEIYGICEAMGEGEAQVDGLAEALASVGQQKAASLRPHLYVHRGVDAVRHLFRVSSSLDSMVVGEPQILGQLKVAFDACRRAGHTGAELGRVIERALAVAKRVRTSTGIGRSSVSISSVAVDLARQIFGDLRPCTAVLVGAGEMGELAARHLVQAGVRELLVANRSLERASRLAEALGGHPRELEELPRLLVEADIVVASTAARGYLVDRPAMKVALKARKHRPVFLIDIAVPRNIDPALNGLENVYVYDVDDLSELAAENMQSRQREAEAAERMVVDEADRFSRELAGQAATPVIVALRAHAQAIREAEVERALRRLAHLDARDRQAIERLAESVTNKLLHTVMTGLKQASADDDGDTMLQIARRLFGLGAEPAESQTEEPALPAADAQTPTGEPR